MPQRGKLRHVQIAIRSTETIVAYDICGETRIHVNHVDDSVGALEFFQARRQLVNHGLNGWLQLLHECLGEKWSQRASSDAVVLMADGGEGVVQRSKSSH